MFLSPLVIGTSGSRPSKRSFDAAETTDDPMASAQPFPAPHWGSDISSGDSELTTGATVGIAVGTIVAFGSLVAVIWALVRWRRRRRFPGSRKRSIEDVYPSVRKGSAGSGGGKEPVEMAMDGIDGHLRYQADSRSEIHKGTLDEADSAYDPSFNILGPDPKPLPGTPSTSPSTPNPNDLSPHPTQGVFDTPPTLSSPSDASPAHLAQFRRFNPSPTSTAVLSRLAKIGDHPVSPSSVGHSQGPSPIDAPPGGAGRWPLGDVAPNDEGAPAPGAESEKKGQWTTFSRAQE